ncbi:DUF317 domain-containing protein [Streptomyces sp. NPDC020875]|uniref:DUF317 domain-containing protein n=1 Tax=Streptomyces sp. NPDC020875 TaxID=3154898 RepID=UPI0033C45081
MTKKITVEQALVSPRALAGGGDPAWITVPLHRAGGWSHGHDPLQPRVLLSSPDQRMLLRLEPAPDDLMWWSVHHPRTATGPAWSAAFGARTPVEIIAGFTDALIQPHAAQAGSAPYAPLAERGWTPLRHVSGFASPDSLTKIDQAPHKSSAGWVVTTLEQRNGPPPLWRARFSGHTPPYLVAGFTRALADPSPLARNPLHLPSAVVRSRITRHEVPADEVARALEQRVQQLTVASEPAAGTTPQAPRVPPPHRRTR